MAATPYSLSTSLCTDISAFNPATYFASLICTTLVPTLTRWAIAMFALAVTGIFASCSGCCLDGCCNCKKTFDHSTAPAAVTAVQMNQVVTQPPFQSQQGPPLPASYTQNMQPAAAATKP